jgi:hypothetical protein
MFERITISNGKSGFGLFSLSLSLFLLPFIPLNNQAQNIGKTSSNNYVRREEQNQKSFHKPMNSTSFFAQFSKSSRSGKHFSMFKTHRLEKCG